MAFRVSTTRYGYLCFRGDVNGRQFWRGTPYKDTPEKRAALGKQCLVMNYEIEQGTFNADKWFANASPASELDRQKTARVSLSLRLFYEDWIIDKNPPLVRKSAARDYRQHFKAYILPQLGDLPVESLTYKDLVKFRSWLVEARKLKVKTCRNIIDGSLRAMYRAVWAEGDPVKNPFAIIEWPDREVPPPDPFTEEQRDRILEKYRRSQPRYYFWVYFMFWTGLRPSEASALRVGDIDLDEGTFTIRKSRNLGEEKPTKTKDSKRTKEMLPWLVDELRKMPVRMHASEEDYFFTNTVGGPIDPGEFRKTSWYGVLAALHIRKRKPYCTRHTLISSMLSDGIAAQFVAEYCGTSVKMLEDDYGKFIRHDGLKPMIKRHRELKGNRLQIELEMAAENEAAGAVAGAVKSRLKNHE